MDYQACYERYLAQAEAALHKAAEDCFCEDSKVCEAAQYSLFAGGKRVRAVLCLAVCETLSGSLETAARYAAAVEMLHCYSLIHDDLPCMDNDDFRRGKPSCHKAYGEATALLAGDTLLTAAFETLATAQGTPQQDAQAVCLLAQGAGARGMVRGQELDLAFENTPADETQLREIHRNKTGMLINAAVQLGAVAADAAPETREMLAQYAFTIGLVFQIIDDVLDVTATQQQLGKPIGSDAASGKTTFAVLHGVEKSIEIASEMTQTACKALENAFGGDAWFLKQLAFSLLERKN